MNNGYFITVIKRSKCIMYGCMVIVCVQCSVFSIGVHSSLFESDGWWFDVDRDRIYNVRFLDLHVWSVGCMLYDGCCCIVWLVR